MGGTAVNARRVTDGGVVMGHGVEGKAWLIYRHRTSDKAGAF
jgi:hypothetical protein